MLKGPQNESGAKAGTIVIDLPESVKKKLPRDFDIDEIGKIDLREAETIASEDILFINENEIIEGLEDFDLIPIKKSDMADFDEEHGGDSITGTGIRKTLNEKARDRQAAISGRKPWKEDIEGYDEYIEGTAGEDIREVKEGEGRNEEKRRLASHEHDYIDDGKNWVPVEKVLESDQAMPVAEQKKPSIIEGYVESDDEYIIWDIPPAEFEASVTDKITKHGSTFSERMDSDASRLGKKEIAAPPSEKAEPGQDEDEVVISKEKLQVSQKPIREIGKVEMIPVEHIEADGAQESGQKPASRQPVRPASAGETATIHASQSFREKSEVVFIEDRTGMRTDDRSASIGDGDLDKIISGVVRFDEGPSYVLSEAGIDEDRDRIALLTDELVPFDEELFVDLDYKYGDEELDYIHTAIAEEDYGDYIREIDEFFGTRGGRTVPTRVELLGMTADEFDTIEDLLFKGDFKDIHLYDRYQLYEFDRGARDGKSKGSKSCRYLLPAENSIKDLERDSIESDISAASALIFEEDVEEIREQLKNRTGKTDIEIAAMLERAVNAGIAEERPVKEETPDVEVEQAAVPEERQEQEFPSTENVFDITDRVVILDDKADVERFISGFPERKQMNIKMLLKYLDGLFEKLPEETIKKFASSDYFELYLKVLNELGV